MGAPRRPIGYERPYKGGYMLVKVSEPNRYDPSAPKGDHVGWKLKHVHVWEQANGMEKPKGCDIVFLDGDKTNYDPANLAPREKRLCGVMNQMRSEGITYNDRESFDACVMIARIRMGIADRTYSGPRECKVCGKAFEPDGKRNKTNASTCRECLDKGLKYHGDRAKREVRTCIKCGREFHIYNKRQRTCSNCQPPCVKRRRKYYVEGMDLE